MQTVLSIVKWLSWFAAASVFAGVLLLTFIGKGVSEFSDIMMVAMWCGLIGFPGLLARIMEKGTIK